MGNAGNVQTLHEGNARLRLDENALEAAKRSLEKGAVTPSYGPWREDIIALIAGALGFTGVAAGAAGIAKILFVVFLVLFVGVLLFALLGAKAITNK